MLGLGKRAIVYITDAGFLMPSLFSASQVLAKSRAREMADLFVILVDVEVEGQLRERFTDLGVRFLQLERKRFWRERDVAFNRTHVPVTSLGRLAMQDVIPDEYEHVLYLDGDTYVAGDIDPLIQHCVAPGYIAAAADCTWLAKGQMGPFWPQHTAYCAGLGLMDATRYFNAGVLAFRMDTWREHAPRALRYFEEHSDLCKYHDQSALNATFKDRREVLSPIWNFQTGYAEIGAAGGAEPRLLHFTGAFKPWRTSRSVWGRAIFEEFGRFMQSNPELEAIHPIRRSPATESAGSFRSIFSIRRAARRIRALRKRAMLNRYLSVQPFAL